MTDIEQDSAAEAYLSGFGKQGKPEFNIDARYSRIERPEYKQKRKQNESKDNDDDDDSDDDDSSDDEESSLPTTHELVFKGHEAAITSIDVDKSGTRFITSSRDNNVRFWDFNGMDPVKLNPFKTIEPVETQAVKQAMFDPSGKNILVISQNTRPQLFSRDGNLISEFASGDMYIVDIKKTKGHVSEISSGKWKPADSNTFLTGGTDSTMRIWDVNTPKTQKSVLYLRDANKITFTQVNWSQDGKQIYGSTDHGKLTIWDTKGAMLRPTKTLEISASGSKVDTFTLSNDHNLLVTRADSGLQAWDLRNLSQPVLLRSQFHGNIGLEFSTDMQHLVTASGSDLHVLARDDLATVQKLPMPSNITSVKWDHSTHQIYAGLASGNVHGLLNRETSTRGMKVVLGKAARARHAEETLQTTNIEINALSEEAYSRTASQQNERKRKAKERESMRYATTATQQTSEEEKTDEQKRSELEDPREALLKYADRAKSEKVGFLQAYNDQEPKVMGNLEDYELDEEERKRKKKRIIVGK